MAAVDADASIAPNLLPAAFPDVTVSHIERLYGRSPPTGGGGHSRGAETGPATRELINGDDAKNPDFGTQSIPPRLRGA